jgi:peptidoglycan/LPS O-acetylase OafA/YrhL
MNRSVENDTRYLPFLDGLRALSVILVVGVHGAGPWTGKLAVKLHGWMGVNIFFVLSGFLVTWLLASEAQVRGSVNLKLFFTRRVLRLCPAYYTYLAVVLVFFGQAALHNVAIAGAYLLNYGVIFGWCDTGPAPLGHMWSLAVEEQFYIVWAIAFACIDRRKLPIFVGGTILVAQGWKALLWSYAENTWMRADLPKGALPNAHLEFGIDTRIDCLLIGCLLGLLWSDEQFRKRAESILANTWSPFVCASALTVALAAQSWHHLRQPLYYWTIQSPVSDLVIAVFILSLLANPRSFLARLLSTSLLTWIGRLSYSIYLWHVLGIEIVSSLYRKAQDQAAPLKVGILGEGVTLLVILALASLSYYVVERPFLILKRRFAMVRS